MLRTTIPDNPFEIRTVELSINGERIIRKILFYQNQEVFLGGIYANTVDLTAPDFDAAMDVLESRSNNFFRHWMIAYWVYYTTEGRRNSCPFKFSNGSWDLRAYNESYFLRLRRMLAAARKAGIIVQLTIFDRCGLSPDQSDPESGTVQRRWSVNPWNAANNVNHLINNPTTGLPDFFKRDANPALAKLQDDYVKKVAMETREFSNVVYEIMNEPMSDNVNLRVKWADEILKVLSPLIQGRRLIFYNDHSSPGTNPANRGQDINYWRDEIPTNNSSYKSLDGVIFHGNPNNINPEKIDEYGWTWVHEQLLQLSSDGFAREISPNHKYRDDHDWNRDTATKLFGGREIFQAESGDLHAANGIRDANPRPTRLRLLPFMGCWDKTSAGGTHFNVRFDNNNRYVAFDPVNDRIMTQGRVIGFTDTSFSVIPDGQTTQIDYTYSLSPDWKTLTYTAGQNTNTFSRVPFDFEPLLFGWEKTGEEFPTEMPRFFLYFKMNNARMSFTKRYPNAPNDIKEQGVVKNFQYYPPQFVFSSAQSGDVTVLYRFNNNGQNLVLVYPGNRETFRRIT